MGYSPWGHKESDMTEQLTRSLSPFYLLCFENLPTEEKYRFPLGKERNEDKTKSKLQMVDIILVPAFVC